MGRGFTPLSLGSSSTSSFCRVHPAALLLLHCLLVYIQRSVLLHLPVMFVDMQGSLDYLVERLMQGRPNAGAAMHATPGRNRRFR